MSEESANSGRNSHGSIPASNARKKTTTRAAATGKKPQTATRTARSRTAEPGRVVAATASTTGSTVTSTVPPAGETAADRTGTVERAAVDAMGDGRQLVTTVTRKAAHGAAAAWTLLRDRKVIAAGAGAGVAVAGACFVAGRRSAVRDFGPLTRATGGRI